MRCVGLHEIFLGKLKLNPAELKLDKGLHVGELSKNGRGGSTASFYIDNRPMKLTLKQCTTPFECRSYDRASDRKSLDNRANDELNALCERLDRDLLKPASRLGCAESGYTSLLKIQKEGFAPLFRYIHNMFS